MLTYCMLAKQTATNSQHSEYRQLKHATPGKQTKSVEGLRFGISVFWWPLPHSITWRSESAAKSTNQIKWNVCIPISTKQSWQTCAKLHSKRPSFTGVLPPALNLDLRPLQCRKLAVCLFLASVCSKASHFGRSISQTLCLPSLHPSMALNLEWPLRIRKFGARSSDLQFQEHIARHTTM